MGTSDGILLIVPLETNFNEILIELYLFSFKNMLLKMSSGKIFSRAQCVKCALEEIVITRNCRSVIY